MLIQILDIKIEVEKIVLNAIFFLLYICRSAKSISK